MLVVDVFLIAALLIMVLIWWLAPVSRREALLTASATAAALIGAFGVWDDRWQLAPGVLTAGVVLTSVAYRRYLRPRKKWRTPWISGSVLTLLLVASTLPAYWYPVTDLPEPTGPFAVGVRDFEVTDSSRLGVLAAAEDEPRRLLVRVWYPAEQGSGRPRPYFTEAEAATTARGLGGLVGLPFYFTYLKHADTNAYEGAPLKVAAEPLPVVVYSHGYTSFAGQNTALMEELASHGYLVFSVQHTHDSSPTVFPDGSVARMDPELIEAMQAAAAETLTEELKASFTGAGYAERRAGTITNMQRALQEGQRIASVSAGVWLDDRRFVLDALADGAVPDAVADVVAAGDYTATGQMGMSFGGSTTGGFCMVDARCAAGINLDGGDYHRTPFNANMPVPFLMLYSDYDLIFQQLGGQPPAVPHGFNDFSYERHELAGLRGDLVRVKVEDVAHLGISDFTLFMRETVRGPLLGSIDSQAAIRIQNDFVRGFFDTYLKGEAVGFPEALLDVHARWVGRDDVGPLRQWWLADHPEDATVRVVLETSLGEVELALYPERAPRSVANFLQYVEGGHYDGATFYRATRRAGERGITVLQGGLLAAAMTGDGAAYAEPARIFPPIGHEPTTETGLHNERGVIAWARLDPGTAGSEFFFNIADNPVLNTGTGGPDRDGHGYATFGRVMRGMRVLEAIHDQPADGETGMARLQGQILSEPVEILRAWRVAGPAVSDGP